MQKYDLIILAGGASSRMESNIPKALIKIKDHPLIDWQIGYFFDHVDKIIISVGLKTLGGQIVDHIGQKYQNELNKFEFALEKEKLGTAGGIKKAARLATSDMVIVINVDDLTDIQVPDLARIVTPTICRVHPTLPYGVVADGEDGYVTFKEKPVLSDRWVSCGWYVLPRQQILDIFPDIGSVEEDVFQPQKMKLRSYDHTGFWISCNTQKEVKAATDAQFPEVLLNVLS